MLPWYKPIDINDKRRWTSSKCSCAFQKSCNVTSATFCGWRRTSCWNNYAYTKWRSTNFCVLFWEISGSICAAIPKTNVFANYKRVIQRCRSWNNKFWRSSIYTVLSLLYGWWIHKSLYFAILETYAGYILHCYEHATNRQDYESVKLWPWDILLQSNRTTKV